MDPRIETVLRDWRIRACDPGYAGLHALAEANFSGAISAGEARGFMVNGRLVGIENGTIESFWSSELSAMEADDPALPLLCAMLIQHGAVEAEYYTGETAISEVHETLSSGSFTGYLELSENVFSGDYFVLYYGGTSRSVALLGTEDRVVTGSEALERANDEVGIYEVKSVDIEVVEIPEAEVDQSNTPQSEPVDEDPGEVGDSASTDAASAEEDLATAGEANDAAAQTAPVEPRPESASTQSSVESESESMDVASLATAAMGGDPGSVATEDTSQLEERPVTRPDEWVTIPALDPGRTTLMEPAGSNEPEAVPNERPAPAEEGPIEEETSTQDADEPTDEEHAALRESLEEAERENERLRDRIDELEGELERIRAAEEEEPGLSPAEALDGTNLFVRYDTKASHTLADAHAGDVDPDAVRQNLQLEWHTAFDASDVTVADEPYESFLHASMEYRFTSWLLEDLLFELIETASEKAFADLFQAIPEVDRVEFSGSIPVHERENGERSTETFGFDLVFRNGMGDPLMVAAVHDSRTPADAEGVGRLLEDANRVARERPTLAGAMYLTRSFFEPEALETVAEATGSSFFGRGSKESYVSVSRKRGFHLCLIEARNHSFHLNVPEG